ncbi:hypothetical protein FJY71_04280 [candidate division WOR-3 bacterium]|nr:hypothetical protein [candidate division WOR-3 bacterium]
MASRLDDPDSAVLGYSIGSATEQRLTGDVMEVFVARPKSVPDPQPEDLLVMALDHALELGLAVADSGWRTGLDAYDGLIASLDTTSFCAGDPQQGQARFRRFLWAMVGCKAGAGRFVEEMKEALPEQAELIDEIAGAGRIIVSKLEGIIQSGVGVESADDRRRIQIVLNEIQLIENDLLGFYEELIGEL